MYSKEEIRDGFILWDKYEGDKLDVEKFNKMSPEEQAELQTNVLIGFIEEAKVYRQNENIIDSVFEQAAIDLEEKI